MAALIELWMCGWMCGYVGVVGVYVLPTLMVSHAGGAASARPGRGDAEEHANGVGNEVAALIGLWVSWCGGVADGDVARKWSCASMGEGHVGGLGKEVGTLTRR